MTLTFEHVRNKNTRRCVESFHPINAWSLSDWATALAEETGEVCGIVKRLNRIRTESKPLPSLTKEELKKELAKEIADVFCYLDLLAASEGISLEDAVVEKFNEVSDRVNSPVKIYRQGCFGVNS